MTGYRVTAYAKINLSLEVLGKRHDGYHEVRSVLQSISLSDDIQVHDSPDVSVECDVTELSGEGNLAARAARDLLDRAGLETGARVRIQKGIPIAAGLGGASSDAAAVIRALVTMYHVKFQESDVQIVAADLGADVPFFLHGGSALVKGRGQLVFPLPEVQPMWLVLLAPQHSVVEKTASLYRRITPELWSSGERTEKLAESISNGQPVTSSLLSNVFDEVADAVFPNLREYRRAMVDAGCESPRLSGAGPALFSIFAAETGATQAATRLSSQGYRPLVARTLTSQEALSPPEPVE